MSLKPNCVIIGHGPGVGAAAARAFRNEGFSLALIARDEMKVRAAAREFSPDGSEARGYAADAGDEISLTDALCRARADLGDPEVMIHNAARWRPGPVLGLTGLDLMEDLGIGLAGALTAARITAPAMVEKGHGSILFTGGGLALYPSPEAPSLSIVKAGLRALAAMLARELAPAGVRAGTVTIAGTVGGEGGIAPERVADAFVALHHGAPDPATAEIILTTASHQ